MVLNLEALKLRHNAAGMIKTAPLLKTLRTKKPENTDFFRIRPGEEWTMDFPIFAPKGKTGSENEKYLVMPEFQQELDERNSLMPVRFYFGIIWGSNILFLSDVGIKIKDDGSQNSYHKSRMELYELAKEKWISISANQELGAYVATEAKSKIPDPIWPTKPANIGEAIELAFKDNVIDRPDHPVLKKLRGEI
jgi:hypothetical protein